MSEHLPYRLPCGGATQDCIPTARHAKPGDDTVPAYKNTTEVPSWDGSGDLIPVLNSCVLAGDGECAPCSGECGEDEFTGYWARPYPANTFALNYENVSVTGPVAVGQKVGGASPYTASGTPVYGIAQTAVAAGVTSTISVLVVDNLAVCKKTGWKGVRGQRQWHGTPGPLAEGSNSILVGCGYSDSPQYVFYEPYEPTPNNLKYLDASFYVETGGSEVSTDTFSWAASIDFYSGVLTGSCSGDPDDGRNSGGDNPVYTNGAFDPFSLNFAFADIQYVLSYLASQFQAAVDEWLPAPEGVVVNITMVGAYWTLQIDESSFGGPVWYAAITDLSALTNNYYGDDGSNPVSESFTIADDSLSYYRINTFSDPASTVYTYITAAYSNPNYGSDVLDDAIDLLAEWDMSDDRECPWRTDPFLSVMPIVTRSEYSSPQSPKTQSFVTVDPTTGAFGVMADDSGYDGSVIGAPFPAGYENAFDFSFIDYRTCCYTDDDEENASNQCAYVNGVFVNDYNGYVGSQIPTNATHWTNENDSYASRPGASVKYNDPTRLFDGCSQDGGSTTGLVAWKYAEIIDVWPSENFARPAGPDKFIFNEDKVYGCYDWNAITKTFTPYAWQISGPNLVAVTGGVDTSGTWGGAAVGGFGTITFDGTHIHFTKTTNLPTGWASASNDTNYCFGQLRYPTCPSILGRASITAIADASMNAPYSVGWTPTYQFGRAQTYYGLAVSSPTESFDFCDGLMNVLATQTSTRVSDTVFTTTSAVPNSAFVVIHSNPAKWYMNDAITKGDVVTLEWLWDFRTNGEYGRVNGILDCSGDQITEPVENYGYASFTQTQHCLPLSSDCPKVVYFGFEEEGFENSVFVQMPTDFVLDERYGSMWNGFVVPTMTDIFWVPPHKPFYVTDGDGNTMDGPGTEFVVWVEDNGTCQPITFDDATIPLGTLTAYYGYQPQVECRLSLPDNYGFGQNETPPAPPGDTETLGFASPVANADGQFPPNPIGWQLGLGSGEGAPQAAPMPAFQLHALFCENADCDYADYSIYGDC